MPIMYMQNHAMYRPSHFSQYEENQPKDQFSPRQQPIALAMKWARHHHKAKHHRHHKKQAPAKNLSEAEASFDNSGVVLKKIPTAEGTSLENPSSFVSEQPSQVMSTDQPVQTTAEQPQIVNTGEEPVTQPVPGVTMMPKNGPKSIAEQSKEWDQNP